MTTERTFQDLINALIEDDTWEVPKEDRETMLMGLEFILVGL